MSTSAPAVVLRPARVAEMLGVSRATLYNWIKAGHFPPPVQLGPNTVAWRTSTVEAWLDAKFASTEG